MATRSEKAKMLAGESYDPADSQLSAEQRSAQDMLQAFNRTRAGDDVGRSELLQALCGRLGAGTVVRPAFRCDYGYNLRLGSHVFVNYDCVFLDGNVITIGDHVQIGPGVHIYTATHPTQADERRSGRESARPVAVGRDAWLGGGAIVLPGVSIGEGSVIGAGSVVTRNIPPGVVAAGNPCRVLRKA